MDNRPIGFFDSGLGGLTSVMELHEILPDEKVIYFGDTARTPYGSKSPDTIREFAGQIVDYLVSKDVKLIIIACNTVTAMALDTLREKYPDVPIYGVIGPVVRKVVKDGVKKVGIIATKATISSDVYSRKIKELDPSIETYSLACPAFVPLVEEGFTDTEIMKMTVAYYLDDFVKDNDFDNLILGCTHYPLVAKHINELYPQLNLYNSSAEVVRELKDYLEENDMLAEPNEFQDRYYASDLSDNFIAMTDLLFKDRDSKIKLVKFED
ncbi:MAG: glutamate racemase [Firmicutes bacterium]|nr:glutamate racemase [Bacillota bacterium]